MSDLMRRFYTVNGQAKGPIVLDGAEAGLVQNVENIIVSLYNTIKNDNNDNLRYSLTRAVDGQVKDLVVEEGARASTI